MNVSYQNLIERIRGEVIDLEQVVQRARQSWSLLQKASAEDKFPYVDSTALNLHAFYSGVERLFELVARQVDGKLPDSDTWHRDLLQQMSDDVPDARPAVISQQNAVALDEFRRFRHLVRNLYTTNLIPAKMTSLIHTLPALWPGIRAELLAFADYLEALDKSS
ncbi:MAG TPA: antitoxin [Anaerolineae bacterium]